MKLDDILLEAEEKMIKTEQVVVNDEVERAAGELERIVREELAGDP